MMGLKLIHAKGAPDSQLFPSLVQSTALILSLSVHDSKRLGDEMAAMNERHLVRFDLTWVLAGREQGREPVCMVW